MQLTEAQIQKFQKLYKKHFGIDINKQEALEKGIKLIGLVELIYRPMTKKEFNQLQQRRRETNNI